MSKPWTEYLTPGEVMLMNDIIAQMPETHGMRDAFVNVVQKLADAGEEPTMIGPKENMFRFYVVDISNGNVEGTNHEKVAQAFADSEDNFVIDVDNNQWLFPEGEGAQEIEDAGDPRVIEDGE